MFKTILLAASAALTLLPGAFADICNPGEIGIGETASTNSSTFINSATIWDSECNQLDQIPGDFDICDAYENGATVICEVGTETPSSVQLGNGLDYGNCYFNSLDACGVSGRTLYCCAPAP